MKRPRRFSLDVLFGKLSDRPANLVGESRIPAAHLAENEKCAQIPEAMVKELREWRAGDDYTAPDPRTDALLIAKLEECARRIRQRQAQFL